jgi:hypothetical protein
MGLLRAFWAAFEDRLSAKQRGQQLLRDNLSATQLAQYDTHQCFDVVGGDTGRRYRVRVADMINVEELNAKGHCTRKLCFQPQGSLVMGDVLLAQKLALELYEHAALSVANAYPPTRATRR